MCSRKESNELFSGQEIGKPRMLQSEKSGGKTVLELSGGGENEEEETFVRKRFMRASSSVRKVEKGLRREECENSREFVKRKGVDVFWGDLVESSA
jgi:hypothetical protein